jgi:ABC-type uncharacterized transport system fused permease/ATPase subunit
MMTLNHVQALQREANFRYSLVRVRDNVESIAFYGGESHEAATIKVIQLLSVIMCGDCFEPYLGLLLLYTCWSVEFQMSLWLSNSVSNVFFSDLFSHYGGKH